VVTLVYRGRFSQKYRFWPFLQKHHLCQIKIFPHYYLIECSVLDAESTDITLMSISFRMVEEHVYNPVCPHFSAHDHRQVQFIVTLGGQTMITLVIRIRMIIGDNPNEINNR
jgi:hypothetical protein